MKKNTSEQQLKFQLDSRKDSIKHFTRSVHQAATALLIQALQRYLEHLDQEEIDVQIAQMVADSEYQELHAQLVKEYEPAGWETLRIDEDG